MPYFIFVHRNQPEAASLHNRFNFSTNQFVDEFGTNYVNIKNYMFQQNIRLNKYLCNKTNVYLSVITYRDNENALYLVNIHKK